jgi:predicted kinase
MTKLIIISGLPGTGKSTLAEALAKELKIPILSVDPIESSIIKSGIKKSFETGLAAYLVAETLAAEHLELGISVIIDAVSPVKEARDMWDSLAEKYNIKKIVIECTLDEKIHKQRIQARVRSLYGIPEVTWKDVEKRKKEYLEWREKRLVLNTYEDNSKNLAKVLNYINIKGKE